MSNETQLATLELDIAAALEAAKKFVVSDDETRLRASESRKQIKQWAKAVDDKYGPEKEALYRPYTAKLEEIKELTDMLDSLEKIFKRAIQDYDTEVDRKRQEAIREEQKRIAALKTENPEAPVQMDVSVVDPVEPPKAAGEYVVEVWEFIVEDFAKIPDEWKVLNEAKVGAAVRAMKNMLTVPGIRVTSRKDVRQRA